MDEDKKKVGIVREMSFEARIIRQLMLCLIIQASNGLELVLTVAAMHVPYYDSYHISLIS